MRPPLPRFPFPHPGTAALIVATLMLASGAAPVRAQKACSPDLRPATEERAELAAIQAGRLAAHWHSKEAAEIVLRLRIAAREGDYPAMKALVGGNLVAPENGVNLRLSIAIGDNDLASARRAYREALGLVRSMSAGPGTLLASRALPRLQLLRRSQQVLASGLPRDDGLQLLEEVEKEIRRAQHQLHDRHPRRKDFDQMLDEVAIDRARLSDRSAAPSVRAALTRIIGTSTGPRKAEIQLLWSSAGPRNAASVAQARDALATLAARRGPAAAGAPAKDAQVGSMLNALNQNFDGAWQSPRRFVDQACHDRREAAEGFARAAYLLLDTQPMGADAPTLQGGLANAEAAVALGSGLGVRDRGAALASLAALRTYAAGYAPADMSLPTAAERAVGEARAVLADCLCRRELDLLDAAEQRVTAETRAKAPPST